MPVPSSMSFVSAYSFSICPAFPLLTAFPSSSLHSVFVISGLISFTSRLFPLFFHGHHALCALNIKRGFLSGGMTLRSARYSHFALTTPSFTVSGNFAIAALSSGDCPSRKTCRVTMLPSAMSFTPAESSISSPSLQLVFAHFTLLNLASFFCDSSRSRFHSSVFSGFTIAGIGMLIFCSSIP